MVLLLPFLATLNGLPLGAAGSTVRLDQLAACALCIPLVLGVLSGRRRWQLDGTSLWLGAILAVNLVASLANSPARQYSLLQCANLASAWVIYVILVNFLQSREDITEMITASLLAASVCSALAIAGFLFALAGFSIGGADLSTSSAESLTHPFGAFGTMLEPNILGSYCAAHLVLAVGVLALERGRLSIRGRWRVRIAATLCSVAVVISFTRSAWIGLAFGLVFLAVMAGNITARRARYLMMPVGAIAVSALLVLLLPGSAADFLRDKITNLLNPESPTAVLRLLTYALAIEQTRVHPVMGWGTFTFAPLAAQGADFAQYAGWRSIWITNFLLLALHDTGVIGLVLWVLLLGSLLVPGWKMTRALGRYHIDDAARAAVLTAALATLLIPFLATTGFSLGYPWVLAGLLGAHRKVTLARES